VSGTVQRWSAIRFAISGIVPADEMICCQLEHLQHSHRVPGDGGDADADDAVKVLFWPGPLL
jgi:hypothetical protein